jgi:hypothetical protein
VTTKAQGRFSENAVMVADPSGPARGGQAPFAFSTVNRVCMAVFYGRGRCLTAKKKRAVSGPGSAQEGHGGAAAAEGTFTKTLRFIPWGELSPGRHCHSTLSLAAIDCHSLGNHTVILLALLSFSAKMTVAHMARRAGARATALEPAG